MNTLEAIRIALASLWANKLRSILTLLGVVIGVAAVIAVVSFVRGINGYVAQRVVRLGADVFMVGRTSNVHRSIDQVLEQEKRKPIKLEDYEAVSDSCHSCTMVGASTFWGSGRVKYGEQSITDTQIRGYTSTMVPITDTEVVAGRAFNDNDVDYASNVAIIGADISEKLFPGLDPLGKELRVDGQLYRVIGQGKKEGKTLGQSRDNYVLIPITAWMRQYGNARTSVRIFGKAAGVAAAQDAAIDEARVVLRSRRHDLPGKPDSFSVETNASIVGVFSQLTGTFFIVMIAIASISLIVGGIVIMNIMLVSVTERTREIGVRKALGARSNDVMLQFLIESSTIAGVGGIIGVIFGISLAKTVQLLIGMPAAAPVWAIFAGVFVAASVGIFFGVYPARRAARLDPIAALRFEL